MREAEQLASTGRLLGRRPLGRRPILVALLALTWLSCGHVSGAEEQPSGLWGTDGTVLCSFRSGNTLYIGGAFSTVGPCSGGGVPLAWGTDTTASGIARVSGYVYAAAPDGEGGWFIGGEFSGVGGKPRTNLAHVRADNTVSDWAPSVSGSANQTTAAVVQAVARAGDTLFIGGNFLSVSGVPRNCLAAVDGRTGEVLPWNPRLMAASPWVNSLATGGDTLFVGGMFDSIGGVPQANLAAVSTVTGTALDFPQANYAVNLVRLVGGTLYVAGDFSAVGLSTRRGLAAIDVARATVTPWAPGVRRPLYDEYMNTVMDIVCADGTVYLGGRLSSVNSVARSGLAAVDSTTGQLRDWNPLIGVPYDSPLISGLALRGDTLYLGGWFESVNGVERSRLAAIAVNDTTVSVWNPRATGVVLSLTGGPEALFVGGSFDFVGRDWVKRYGLAALDLRTGRAKNWRPDPYGLFVGTLAMHEGRLYVGGDFDEIGGQPRSMVAAVDTLTGTPYDWNPGANAQVAALTVRDSVVYVGGSFTQVGGQARSYVAALDASTGDVLPWNPAPNDEVDVLLLGGNTLFMGGWFTSLGGVPRLGMGAVDAKSGAIAAWDPRPNSMGQLDGLAQLGRRIYACGAFSSLGGQTRHGLAAVDDSSGAVLPWDPEPYGEVRCLATDGQSIYAGGEFLRIGGQARTRLAALDPETGLATDWDFTADNTVRNLTVDDHILFVGGSFRAISGTPASYIARIELRLPPPPELPPSFALWQNIPNPAHQNALVRFSLPTEAEASLRVYDVQGRRVGTPVPKTRLSAGIHSAAVDVSRWPAGVYFYRLESAGRHATRKMIVLE
jgi:trimeric autotransporter adhesin